MHVQKREQDMSFFFYFYLYWHVFSSIEELQGLKEKAVKQVWGRFLTASSLMWSLILTNHKRNPCLPPGDAVFFLPSAWSGRCLTISVCFVSGGRNPSRWKEKRVLVGAAALDFKPYKICDAPQSQTSNRQRVVERRRSRMILSGADLVLGATGQPCLSVCSCWWVCID